MATAIVVLVVLAACYGVAVYFGRALWSARTDRLTARLRSSREPLGAARFDPSELVGLPAPVQRYFRAALPEGQPLVTGVRIRHEGQFNMGHRKPKWRPFTSEQAVSIARPGFLWNAEVQAAPGLHVCVHDGYIRGEGIMSAALLGVIGLVDNRGGAELNQGELVRFLAEAVWYPTALLPSRGVRWEEIDSSSAVATFVDGDTTASLHFSFGAEGLVESVWCRARSREVAGERHATPWQARVWAYETRDGMRVPTEGEVAWVLLDGPAPYWRAKITGVEYEFGG